MFIHESMKEEARVKQGQLLPDHDHVPSAAAP